MTTTAGARRRAAARGAYLVAVDTFSDHLVALPGDPTGMSALPGSSVLAVLAALAEGTGVEYRGVEYSGLLHESARHVALQELGHVAKVIVARDMPTDAWGRARQTLREALQAPDVPGEPSMAEFVRAAREPSPMFTPRVAVHGSRFTCGGFVSISSDSVVTFLQRMGLSASAWSRDCEFDVLLSDELVARATRLEDFLSTLSRTVPGATLGALLQFASTHGVATASDVSERSVPTDVAAPAPVAPAAPAAERTRRRLPQKLGAYHVYVRAMYAQDLAQRAAAAPPGTRVKGRNGQQAEEFTKYIGQRWSTMSDGDRIEYVAMAARENERRRTA